MNNFKIKLGLISTLALALFISSCNKDTNTIVNEGSTIRLNIGQAFTKSASTPAKVGSVGRTFTAAAQTIEVPYNNEYTLVATLTPVNTAAISTNSLKASNRAASSGVVTNEQVLKQGTVYYVAIFDASGNYKETKTFTQGAGAQDFAIDKGRYTFVIYASGTNKPLPTIAAGAKLSTVNFTDLKADQDFMLDQVAFEVKDGQNVLNADLEHLFTQVTLKFDSSKIGAVTAIAGAHISPSNANADVVLSTGAVSYTGATTAPVVFRLKNTTGTVIESDSTFLTTAATTTGVVELSGLSIANSAAKVVSFKNLKLNPGVKYVMELALKAPISTEIGGEVWALGNLTYDNGIYGFAATNDSYGNYWFPGFQKPKVLDGSVNNQRPSATINGGSADPCSLVLPLDTWRLPTKAEIDQLIKNTNAGGVDNPQTENNWAPARWVDTYDGTAGTNLGMFFGSQVNPGADRYKEFYLPYGGSYNDNNTGDSFGSQGLYLLADKQRLQMTGTKNSVGWSINTAAADANFAYQIRCIKK